MRAFVRCAPRFSALFMLVWCTAGSQAATFGVQESRDPAVVVVHDVHIRSYGVANALAELSKEQHIVIGYEGVNEYPENTIQIDESSGTVAEILNKIVAQAPSNAWRITDSGTIRVYNAEGRVSLVDVKPTNFVISGMDRREIWKSLERIPELKSWLDQHQCTRGEIFMGHEWSQNMKKISLDTEGKPLGRILDDVAGATGTYFWKVVQAQADDRCVVRIFLW